MKSIRETAIKFLIDLAAQGVSMIAKTRGSIGFEYSEVLKPKYSTNVAVVRFLIF